MSGQWKPGDIAVATVRGQAGSHGLEQIADARPLVVLDPEDREQMECLFDALRGRVGVTALADALRSLVAPPKPDEPTGLGAVVEDDDGRTYIRTADTDCRKPWSYANNFSDHDWADVNAVRVLSEGVTDTEAVS